MNNLQRGWARIRASLTVLKANKKLYWFPIIAWTSMFLACLAAGSIMNAVPYFQGYEQEQTLGFTVIVIITLMIVNYIGITMAAATYAASNQALEGEKISIRRSFAQVWQNRAALTRWWLFSSLVFGVIQIINHLLETFSSLFGPVLEKVFPALVNSILSVTWGVATYFSIPILMQHPDRPVATLKQSAQLFKQTWGERFSMNIGIGLVGLINLGLSLLLTAIITLKLLPLILVGISNSQFQLLFFIIFLSLSSIFATIIYCADSIFKASLFRYAETGDYVGPFNADLIQTAFTPKRNRFQRSASN